MTTVDELRKQANDLDLDVPDKAKKEDLEHAIANADVDTAAGRRLVGPGSAGADVHDLATRLAKLGYETSVTSGDNAFAVFDDSILNAVRQFRKDNTVDDDDTTGTLVGAHTWAALLRATS